MKRLILASLILIACLAAGLLVWRISKPPSSPAFAVGPARPAGRVPPQLAATWDRAYLLAPDGSLWAWGGTQFGLADIQISSRTEIPRRLGTNSDWRKISASWTFAVALKTDGSLWGWGSDSSGELTGVVKRGLATTPVRLGNENDWAELSVGASHGMALKTNGSLWTWGQNNYGQIGDGTTSNRFSPFEILPGSRWRASAAGSFNSYALGDDGTIWGWGLDPTTGGKRNDLSPAQIGTDTNWIALAAGDYHLLGLKRDGTVWIHGQNAGVAARGFATSSVAGFVQLGTNTDWREIYCGQNFSVLRKADGSWWLAGDNSSFRPRVYSAFSVGGEPRRMPESFEPWAFAAGGSTIILLNKDGKLWTWGDRLGSVDRRTTFRDVINFLSTRLGRRAGSTPSPKAIEDSAPHFVWELPAEGKSSSANSGH